MTIKLELIKKNKEEQEEKGIKKFDEPVSVRLLKLSYKIIPTRIEIKKDSLKKRVSNKNINTVTGEWTFCLDHFK